MLRALAIVALRAYLALFCGGMTADNIYLRQNISTGHLDYILHHWKNLKSLTGRPSLAR